MEGKVEADRTPPDQAAPKRAPRTPRRARTPRGGPGPSRAFFASGSPRAGRKQHPATPPARARTETSPGGAAAAALGWALPPRIGMAPPARAGGMGSLGRAAAGKGASSEDLASMARNGTLDEWADEAPPPPGRAGSDPADTPPFRFHGSWAHKLHKHKLDKLTVCSMSTSQMRDLLSQAVGTASRRQLIAMTLALQTSCEAENWLTVLGEDFWREVFLYLDLRTVLGTAARVCTTFRSLVETGDVFTNAVVGAELENVVTNAHMPHLARLWQSAETVDLACCTRLTSVALQHVSTNMRHLHTVNLSFCSGIGDGGIHLLCSSCRRIEKLSLASCSGITDNALKYVGALEDLAVLELDNCSQLSDAGLVRLRNHDLRSLSLLLLTEITDYGVKSLVQHCPRLEHLRLELVGELTDLTLQYLGGSCPRLQTLGLERGPVSHINDLGVKQLARGCHHLQYLDLSRCVDLTDKSLVALGAQCPELNALFVGGCPLIGDAGLKAVAKGCRGLESLSVSGCAAVSDAPFKELAKYCKVLQYLDMSSLPRVTDTALHRVSACTQLSDLFVRGCPNLTDAGIEQVARSCALQTLHAGDCDRLTDESLAALADCCDELGELHIAGCPEVTGRGLAQLSRRAELTVLHAGAGNRGVDDNTLVVIAKNCPDLEELVLAGTPVSDTALKVVGRSLERLRTLGLETCHNLSVKGLDAVVEGCPNLSRVVTTGCNRLPDVEDLNERYPEVEVEDGYFDDEERAWVADAPFEDGSGGEQE